MKEYYFYDDLLKQVHLLIGGATGSGKSVIVNGMIYTILLKDPHDVQFVLIDPKRVELSMYRSCPHCLAYASEKETMYETLVYVMDICEQRYKDMTLYHVRKYPGSHIYVFIDELADLLTTDKKRVMPLLQRLAQISRAAGISLVCCTQSPISAIIPTQIKVNFDSRIALRTACKQDSRNIIGIPDAADLPKHGYCYYKKSMGIKRCVVPYYTDSEIYELINYWHRPQPKKKKRFLFF